MAFFPFFRDIAGKKGLIVGGGSVALRKAEKLQPFGPQLIVAAPEIRPEFSGLGAELRLRPFCDSDISDDLAFVIAACDNREVNRRVHALCVQKNIPVNVADAPELCTFLFPALVTRGKMTIGITTGGASPSASAWVRGSLEEALPEGLEEILLWMEEQRKTVKKTVPPEKRAACLRRLFAACLEEKKIISDDRADRIIGMEMENYGNEK